MIRTFQFVRCLRCGHTWDDLNPDDEVCACILIHGSRQVVVISEGATNQDSYFGASTEGER